MEFNNRKPDDYNPMARETFGRGLLDLSSAILKGITLPLTVMLPVMGEVQAISISKAVDIITSDLYLVFLCLFALSFTFGLYLRKEGLRHLHELENTK